MRRNKRGITLIALIITVIVLLILAGVTMSFVVGDNGVVTQAQKAKIRTEEEEAKEEIEMEVVGCYNGSGDIDLGVLNDRLKKKGGVSFKKTGESDFVELKDGAEGEEGNQIESLPVTVKYKNVEVEITGEYTGGVDRSKTASELTPQEDYGKFVKYGVELSGDDDDTNDWKIFYIGKDEDGTDRIYLIAADYVPNDCSVLKEAMEQGHSSMKQVEKDGHKVCCINWSKDSLPAYNCKKGVCTFPGIFMPSGEFCLNHYDCSSHTDASKDYNSLCAGSLQCIENWKSFAKGDGAEYAIGGPTVEMWVASWNQTHRSSTKLKVDGSNETGYKIGTNSRKFEYAGLRFKY